MSIYKFRVLIEDENEIFRDIEISDEQNFEELHQIILSSFNFDNSQMASFYLSDSKWNKGQEIALFDMNISSNEDDKMLIMNETIINTVVTSIGHHLLYTYDFLNMWDFFIKLIEITPIKENETYPKVVHSQGEAPRQDSKNNVLSNEEIAEEIMNSSRDKNDIHQDDIFEGFDDFEDYR